MKRENRNKGRRGEELAVKVLRQKGYRIVARNWGNRYGEIDIIAQDGETLVFVEVKAKTGEIWGTPEQMVNERKLAKVKRMAEEYVRGRELACRIDVVALVFDGLGEVERWAHYEGVGA